MYFDIISVTEEELANYSAVQMQLLRTAQKKKDKMLKQMDDDLKLFEKLVMTNDMKSSSLIAQKAAELQANYDYELEILVEQLEYSLQLNAPYPDDEEIEQVGYIVDFSLSYTERYNIVRDYYLSIETPAERMALYSADNVARKYLSSYYNSLYDLLSTYSR